MPKKTNKLNKRIVLALILCLLLTLCACLRSGEFQISKEVSEEGSEVATSATGMRKQRTKSSETESSSDESDPDESSQKESEDESEDDEEESEDTFGEEPSDENEEPTIQYGDLNGDGFDEMISSYAGGASDFEETIITIGGDSAGTVLELPDAGGYYYSNISVKRFDQSSYQYLCTEITNGVHPLGCAVYGIRDGELINFYYEASATGAGDYGFYDNDDDGIYDEIITYRGDYGVCYHNIEQHYRLENETFVMYQSYYGLSEYATEPEDVIFDYLDMLWLEWIYGENADSASRITEILTDEKLRQIDVSEYIEEMYTEDYAWTMEHNLEFTDVSKNDTTKEFKVTLKEGSIKQPLIFSLKNENEKWRITDIAADS